MLPMQRSSQRRLVLHVGTHKTGTSYLQELFLKNQDVLGRYSIGLANFAHPTLGHHHHLVNLITGTKPRHEEFLAALQSENQTVIFSSECMLPWLMIHEEAAHLCKMLTVEWDVQVVIYLRRQDFMKESVFAEVATDWYQGDIQGEDHYCYDYLLIIEQLASLFGSKRILVGIYRDDRPQDLAHDFFELAGLGYATKELEPIPPARVSPNRTITAILAKCHKEDATALNQVREILTSAGIGGADLCKYQLSPEERRLFLSPFIESNRKIARLYCPHAEDYMTLSVPGEEEWRPIPPLGVQEVSDILDKLIEAIAALRAQRDS